MLRSVDARRVVYEAIPLWSWVAALTLLVIGATCVVSAPPHVAGGGYRVGAFGLAVLLVRRRVVCERSTRAVNIAWVLSLAPGLPALGLRQVSFASLDMFRGVFVASHRYKEYNPRTSRRETVAEHDIRFTLGDRAFGAVALGDSGALIHRVSALGGRARAIALGRQIAADLGLPFDETLGGETSRP